ncbi:MAG: alpha/beta hydrolase, partial [Geodermatophilaceae bacterium]
LRLPRFAAKALTVNLAKVVKLAGVAITPISSRIPVGARMVHVLTHSGFMMPLPDPELAAVAIGEFLQTPIEWYFHLALRTSEHGRVSLSRITVPVLMVGATWDILAGTRHMMSAAERVQHGVYVELRGTHFIAMEQPERVHQLLIDFLAQVG